MTCDECEEDCDPQTTRRAWLIDPVAWYYLLSPKLMMVALVLSFLAFISLPKWPRMYIARTHFHDAATVIQTSEGLSHNLSEIRVSLPTFY